VRVRVHVWGKASKNFVSLVTPLNVPVIGLVRTAATFATRNLVAMFVIVHNIAFGIFRHVYAVSMPDFTCLSQTIHRRQIESQS
jgi:hypothetical protein